jgi:hypothetical protein
MDNRVSTQWIALRPGIGVGVVILAGWTRVGAYVASAWLLGVAANLVAAGFYETATVTPECRYLAAPA